MKIVFSVGFKLEISAITSDAVGTAFQPPIVVAGHLLEIAIYEGSNLIMRNLREEFIALRAQAEIKAAD
jgi:hypothetical protein